ncbi:hypothetical protein ARMSODRAFT_984017 [Armillaria solidipes]|uniref:Uncharacterized protein n=1 Tax=Armillaria solidipes TaxID=1076256 RepID=A0A2H3AGW6_9AGAR|nr:hypothetical protein ARMSODRAFT_984017 [Armillaria solidipes]
MTVQLPNKGRSMAVMYSRTLFKPVIKLYPTRTNTAVIVRTEAVSKVDLTVYGRLRTDWCGESPPINTDDLKPQPVRHILASFNQIPIVAGTTRSNVLSAWFSCHLVESLSHLESKVAMRLEITLTSQGIHPHAR